MFFERSSIITQILTYYPLILTVIGTILNSLILIIFSQDKFRQRPIFSFYNHVVNQSSAWLRVLMCADRFYMLNRISTLHRYKNSKTR